jgi:group I intron endonuclease
MIKKIGIYKIKNPNGKVYIGQTIDYDRRLKSYQKYRCKNQLKLYNSLIKYGLETHTFQFLESCLETQLNERERFWQEHYNSLLDGLNLKLTTSKTRSGKYSAESKEKMKGHRECMSGQNNPFYGKAHSTEVLKKISRLGKQHSVISKSKISNTLTGVNKTQTHSENISKGLMGHAVSKEQLLKQSNSMREWHKNNNHPLLGKQLSDETKRKISQSQKERIKKKKNSFDK